MPAYNHARAHRRALWLDTVRGKWHAQLLRAMHAATDAWPHAAQSICRNIALNRWATTISS